MYRLIYSSVAVAALDDAEMETLLGVARELNARDRITGILLHIHTRRHPEDNSPVYFVQLLEGCREAVEATYRRITRDELHHGLEVLTSGPTQHRAFTGWSMRLEDLSVSQTLDAQRADPGHQEDQAPRSVAEWVRSGVAMEALIAGYGSAG